MTDYEVLALAHRVCWKYKHGDKGDTYTFDKETMLEFVRILKMMEKDQPIANVGIKGEMDGGMIFYMAGGDLMGQGTPTT
mgnify:CR=1 FL=1